ncbi:enoyl-CoA hydratase-related protein [Microbacterium sp. NPDC055910]|uniref:enoyl-CoA hydratase-related protein n=1 Tax=Microbacterium sp. NPDC055910 TaxID=3345659 RepID=UPI0035E02C4E
MHTRASAADAPPPSEETVLLDVADGIATITLNRPARLNAMNGEMQRALPARLAEAADRDDVRVIILTGAGRGFCAGADFSVLEGLGDGDEVTMPERELLIARTIPKPVIGVVNGPCAGIGLVFALACDIRFAAADATFGTGFARRGLVAEQGLAWLLTNLVGPSRAMDLLFTSRTFDGVQARRLGVVDHVRSSSVLAEAAREYARGLIENGSAVSMGVMKWQVQRAAGSSFWEAFDDDADITQQALTGRDFVQIGSRLGKERPDYAPIPAGRLGDAPPVHLIPTSD